MGKRSTPKKLVMAEEQAVSGGSDRITQVLSEALEVPEQLALSSRRALVIKGTPAEALGIDVFVHAVCMGWIAKDREWNVWYLTPAFPHYHDVVLEHAKQEPLLASVVAHGSNNRRGILHDIIASADLAGLPKVILREARRLGWVQYDLRKGSWFRTSECPVAIEG